MARDKELLDTARDYFQFVSRFFEVIKASAPHIYHSTLELSPEDSIVQHHYYQWSLGHHTPHVVCGISSSWDDPAIINGRYKSYAWSPCGQLFSAQTSTSVDVWDSLTLEKQSSLQLPKPADIQNLSYHIPHVLSYSSDGHSLVSFIGSAIVIWDIQTGGVVQEIECGDMCTHPESLVWSLDGQAIGAIFPAEAGTWVVCIYNIGLGVKESTSILQSFTRPWLWSHNKSLQAMTMLADKDSQAIINIFEIWPTFINTSTKPYSIKLKPSYIQPHTMSFSPAIYWISAIVLDASGPCKLVVLDIQTSGVLLLENENYTTGCLSPDGSLLVAYMWDGQFDILKHCPEEGYTVWMRFPAWSGLLNSPQGYLFSPTLSSVLVSRENSLEVKHLDGPRTTPLKSRYWYCEQFSANGTYVVIAPYGEQIVTITNLNGVYTQSIKPGFSVHGLALTKNVLLVLGHNKLAGWLLTEGGMVDEVSGGGVSDQDGRLWILSISGTDPQFWVEGHIGVIEYSKEYPPFCYDTEIGEELESIPDEIASLSVPSWKEFSDGFCNFKDQYLGNYYNFSVYNDSSEDGLSIPIPWYEGGWVKYPEGKYWHKFWLPVHWRPGWNEAYWLNDVTTLRLRTTSGLAIIKFHLESPPS